MRKILLTLFIMVILSVGAVGVAKSTDNPDEVIEENGVSAEINL